MTLTDVWNLYSEGDYLSSLESSLQTISRDAGIDLLHIAGLSLMNLQRHEEGLTLLKAATTLRPQSPHIYSNAAYVAEQWGFHNEVDYFADRGLFDFPDDESLLLLKANNLVVQLQFDAAAELYHRLLQQNPQHVQSLVNLGNIARAKDDFTQAEQLFAQAAEIEPELRDLIFAQATMATQRGQRDRAVELLEPIANDIDAQFLLSLLYLHRCEYERGFRLYRCRGNTSWYRTGQLMYPLKPFDHWTEAEGKNIAIIREGGFGDLIQYMRYFPKLAEIAKSITLFVPSAMVRLQQLHAPSNVVVKSEFDKAEYDYITTDSELPYSFRTSIDTIPVNIPYLFVPEAEIKKHVLPHAGYRRVGLCWSGGERDLLNQRSYDERRSIDLKLFAPINDIEGIELVSLQYGPRADDTGVDLVRVIDASFDFLDTAAVIAQLDLVISVDTSIVHLAAAMGKETWLLSRWDHCWRWPDNQSAPWYPHNVRIFGQEAYRDWSVPLKKLTNSLEAWAHGRAD